MPMERASLPPAGYLELCRREPAECGVEAGDGLPELYRAQWEQAFSGAARKPAEPAAYSETLWGTLNAVNQAVNTRLEAATDSELFGADDVWVRPTAVGLTRGDCEDFVLEKRRALVEKGVPSAVLSIAMVTTRQGERHAVLLVRTDRGEYVLDNRSPWISLWSQLDYRWEERQLPGAPLTWVQAGAARPSPSLGSGEHGAQHPG